MWMCKIKALFPSKPQQGSLWGTVQKIWMDESISSRSRFTSWKDKIFKWRKKNANLPAVLTCSKQSKAEGILGNLIIWLQGKKGQTPRRCQIPHLKTHLYTVFKYSAINYAIKSPQNLHLRSLNVKYWAFHFYMFLSFYFVDIWHSWTCHILCCCIFSKTVFKKTLYFQSLFKSSKSSHRCLTGTDALFIPLTPHRVLLEDFVD